jgi:tellurite resistance protein TehA-like permease
MLTANDFPSFLYSLWQYCNALGSFACIWYIATLFFRAHPDGLATFTTGEFVQTIKNVFAWGSIPVVAVAITRLVLALNG